MTDLIRQPSGCCLVPTGCPVDEAGSNESEAISVTSGARRNAVSDVSWQTTVLEAGRVLAEQITEQQFEKDIDFSTEAIAPRVARESYGRLEEAHKNSSKVINCELAALRATEPSVGEGRVPARDDRSLEDELLTHVRTCRDIPATKMGDDGEVDEARVHSLPDFSSLKSWALQRQP